MATKKAAADKGTAKRTSKRTKTAAAATTPAAEPAKETYLTLESEADATATTPTDKDLQEGAISDVVTETAETPVVVVSPQGQSKAGVEQVVKVYSCIVTHHHASGPKKHYKAALLHAKCGKNEQFFSVESSRNALEATAVDSVNIEHGLELVHGAENVTVEPTLVDFYFVEG